MTQQKAMLSHPPIRKKIGSSLIYSTKFGNFFLHPPHKGGRIADKGDELLWIGLIVSEQ
jgi:hypothetical protein